MQNFTNFFNILKGDYNSLFSKGFKKYAAVMMCIMASVHDLSAQTCTNAQLEMAAGAGNPTTNGPSIANQTITFQNNTNNPAGNTLAAYTPALTATYSISNQQYTNVAGVAAAPNNVGMTFGQTITSGGQPLFNIMNGIGTGNANSVNFSSSPYSVGAGIDVAFNRGVNLTLGTRPLFNANASLTGNYYYGDLTITFSQPVDNPIIQIADIGGFYVTGANQRFGARFKVASGQTLTRLSGDAAITLVGNDSIHSVITTADGTGNFLDGSFMVNQFNVTSITLQITLVGYGNGTAWAAATGINSNPIDALVIGITIPDFVPSQPNASKTVITNTCPATTVNLNATLPAAIAGQIYEWHTVPNNPSVATRIVNPTTYAGVSPVYLFAKDSLTGCFSTTGDTVGVNIVNCNYTISCTGTTVFREEFGSAMDNLNFGASGASHPYDSTFCINGFITNNTAGYIGTGVNFTNDVAGDGDTGTHFLAHFSGVGGPLCSNAVGQAAWLNTANINVVAGQVYEFSYYYRLQNNFGSATVIQQQVVPASGTITTISTTNNPIQNANWVKNTMRFVPSASGPVTLRLNNMLGPVGGNDFALDNIALRAIITDTPKLATSNGFNTCPNSTADLTSFNPTTPSGLSYEWHTVATNPSAATLVSNPNTVGAGTYYIYVKSGTSCLSALSDTLTVTIYNPCQDCDSDGVPNEVDIDDDNDGVLDVVETVGAKRLVNLTTVTGGAAAAPTGAANSTASGSLPNGTVVTISETSANLQFENAFITNNSLCYFNSASYSAASEANADAIKLSSYNTATTGLDSFIVNFSSPVNDIYMYVKELDFSKMVFPSNVTLSKISGNADLIVNNTTKEVADNTPNTATPLTCGVDPNSAEGIVRIQGTNISSLVIKSIRNNTLNSGDAFLVNFGLPFSYLDTDNDGLPNTCDTDDDGDGCPTAYEAGVSANKTALTVAGPYGANGLANSIENNDSPTASITYTSTYSTYGLDSTSANGNLCNLPDCDGDGIANVIDIDDDNDGVLDVVENCSPTLITGSLSATAPVTVSGITVTPSTTTAAPGSVTAFAGDAFIGAGVHINKGFFGNSLTTPLPTSATVPTTSYTLNFSQPIYSFSTTFKAQQDEERITFSQPATSITNQLNSTYGVATPIMSQATLLNGGLELRSNLSDVINSNTSASFGSNSTVTWNFATPVTQLVITHTGVDRGNPTNRTTTYNGTIIGGTFSLTTAPPCNDRDGDGLPNSCDTDDDGDGCPTAYEAGASANKTALTVAGPYGANGLANSIENNDSPTASVTYSSTYSAYGLDSTSANGNLCNLPDCDGDGIANVIDIDDDNDGVLDQAEMNCEKITNGNFTNNANFGWTYTGNVIIFSNSLLFNSSQAVPNGTASQIVSTAAGQNLTLTYTIRATVVGNVGARVDIFDNTTNQLLATKSIVKNTAPTVSNEQVSFVATGASTRVVFTDISTVTNNIDVDIDNISILYCDSDNDGIPNTCETDDDGDGCPTAYEAGSSTSKTALTVAGPYGLNGLANSLENNDSPTATVSYTNTYNFAADSTLNLCQDCDNDGVSNVLDIDDDNDGILDSIENNGAISFTGAEQTFVVPCNVTQLNVKLWGAGGAGGNTFFNSGGSGGFTSATIPVTPGETLTLIVGQGGRNRSTVQTFGGGGAGGTDAFNGNTGASGGGRSEIRRGSTTLVVAGGGGGAGGNTNDATSGSSHGGGGGGLTGSNAKANNQAPNGNGKGGTQTAGGAGGIILAGNSNNGFSGTQYQGGNGGPGGVNNGGAGGGGGGGWYGGGGGSGYGGDPYQESAGGGGSGYAFPSATNVVMANGNIALGVANINVPAANNTDPNYIAGVGLGGSSNGNSATVSGGNGLIFIAELLDLDNDGIANSCDLDSDGDGCPDAVEAGTKTLKTDSVFTGPVGANGLVNSIENKDSVNATVINMPYYSASKYTNYAQSCTRNVCNDDCDNDGIPNIHDLDDDNDGVLDALECPGFKVYTYNRTATWSTNAPYTITGENVQNVIVNQSTAGTDLTSNGVNWKLIASNVQPDVTNKIAVSLLPTATTNGSFLAADAVLITNGVNTYIIDNSATSGFATTGTWVNQNFGANYLASETFSNAPHTGKTATWTFSNIPALATYCDTDADGISNTCDNDDDGDGCPTAYESGASNDKIALTLAGPYGSNGLANSIENNDSLTATTSYATTYATYALDSSLSKCKIDTTCGVPTNIVTNGNMNGTNLTAAFTGWTTNNATNNSLGGWIVNTAGTNQYAYNDHDTPRTDSVSQTINICELPTNDVELSFVYSLREGNNRSTFKVFWNGLPYYIDSTADGASFIHTISYANGASGNIAAGSYSSSTSPIPWQVPGTGWGRLTLTIPVPQNAGQGLNGRLSFVHQVFGGTADDVFFDSVVIRGSSCINAGLDTAICINQSVQLKGKSYYDGTATWSAVAGNPATTTIATPTADSTMVTGFTTAGTYKFILSNGTCPDTVNVVVSAKPNAGPDQNICVGNTATMAAVGTGTWTPLTTNPATSTITTPSSATSTITGFTTAGTYNYVWANATGCTDTASVIVTAPTAITVTGTSPICTGSSATLTASGASTYTIMPGSLSNPATVNPITTTVYTVIGTNATGCTSTTTISITVNPLPAAPIATLVQPNCTTATGTITVTAPTGAGLTYSIDGTTFTNSNGIFNAVAPNTYTVTVKSADGCTATSSVTILPQPASPAAPTASVTQPTCTVATGTITITAPTGAGITYSTDGVTYTNTTGVFLGMATGSYSLTAQNAAGCISPQAVVIVDPQPATPAPPVITPTAATICNGTSALLNATGCSGNVTWYDAAAPTVSIGTGSSLSVNPTTTQSYIATCTNPVSGCTSTASSPSTITVVAPPSGPSISVNNNNICVGGSITLTGTSCASPNTLSWTKNGAAFGTGLSLIDAPAAGTYTYAAICNTTGAVSCASAASNLVVTVNALPATPSITSNPTTICAGASATLTATGAVGTETYVWSTGQTGASVTVSPTSNTSYTVKILNPTTSCESAVSTPVTVTVTPTPTAAPTASAAPATICAGASSTLSATCSLGTAQWYTNNTFTTTTPTTVSPATTTTYYVRCENSGCFGPASPVIVTVNAKPSKPLASATQPVCPSVEGSISITAPTGANMTYSLNNSTYTNTTGSFTALTAGSYTATAKSDLGCISDTTQVIINEISCPDTTIVQPNCPTCPTPPICPTANSLPSGPGAITYSTCGTPSGYTAAGPDANGCMTFTPSGANTTNDTTCVIACKNGICDTTVIIIEPPIKPDTINRTTPCATCPVTACATGDDLGAGPYTVSTCGTPAGYTAIGPDAAGCMTFTPSGLNATPDTTCIVKCDASGKCDTTYVILNSTPKPDTLTETPACPTCPVSACATGDDLGAGPYTYSNCGTPGGYAATGPDAAGCMTFTPTGPNTTPDTTCIVKCDASGKCDTTYVIINPPVKPDTVFETPSCPTCPVDVCATGDDLGAGPYTYATCGTPSGYAATGPNAAGCMTFTPTGPNTAPDTTCIVKCDASGKCDTTYVIINPPVKPDTVFETPVCPTCPVDVCATGDDLGAGPYTYATCGTPSGYAATGPNAAGCMTFTPTGPNTTPDTTCIVKCDASGKCDTTYVIINPPVKPDTIFETPACPTCPVDVCATGDDLGAGPYTYATCGTPSGYAAIGPNAAGCMTFTPTGPNTTPDTTCIVKCDASGKCDTTYVIINPPVKPDTVFETPACPTCPVDVCATGDDLGAGPYTYTTCGTPSGYTATGPDAAGCMTFTPNGPNTAPDSTCIVKCDASGKCDTTYVIINPPIKPDTQIVTPTCPTCPINVCATGDDLGAGPYTYATCGTPTGYTAVGPNAAGCMTFTPNGPNTAPDSTCIVKCDASGKCDTTYVIINPPIKPDTVIKQPACPSCPVDACATGDDLGAGPYTYTTCGTPSGYTAVGPNAAGCMTFTPNGPNLGPDTTCIVKCDASGKCDTTYVIILKPITPDTVTIKPTCPTCPAIVCATKDDIPVNGTTTYSTCGLSVADAALGSMVTTPSGCLIWQGNSNFTQDTIETCIVACTNGVCDTTYINILPPTPPFGPDTFYVTPICSSCPTTPICPTADDIPSGYTNKTTTNCGVTSTQGALSTNAAGCVIWTPNGTQTDTIRTCVIMCADTVIAGNTFTICDTTVIFFPPPPVPDSIDVTPACKTCPVVVCATADDVQLNSGSTIGTCGTPPGYTIAGPSASGCYTFTPNASVDSIPDLTCIYVCTNGVCDTTYITINPPIEPDTIIVTPACPTCPTNVCATGDDLGAGPYTYATCGTPSGYAAVGPDAAGCLTFTPTGPNTTADSTCVVKCDASGKCDTTYIIINPPITPDTVIVTPACPTCPVNACATGDNLGAGPYTYATCGTPSGYAAVGPNAAGCMTFTPNGPNTAADSTCIVKCDASGKCDTTYVIINPPIQPDTQIVTPACPTCPVDICATGDDLGAGPYTYATCGTPNGYSAVGPNAAGCMTFTPNGPNTAPDSTCIVKCDASGKCDTTYIIINPPVKPDTVIVTPTCATCPVNVCATGDDLGAGPYTYATCGTPGGYAAVGPDATGCLTFTPTGPNTTADSTCIVKCDASGKCDTTYIIINPPIVPDTVIVTPACPTCPVNVCATGDDLGTGPYTYATCGTPAGYSAVGPDAAGCMTFTPTGPNYTTDSTCIVKCDASGKCDTTYIIINPPTLAPDPDVNITNVNVPVPGDVSTNDENIPPGSTYGNPAPNPSNPGGATPVINPDGTYSFTSPVPGVFTFDVPVVTPNGDTVLVPLTITVLDPTKDNDPVANTDQATTTPTTPVVIPTLANDQAGNPGSPLVPGSVVITDQPSNGTTSVNPITGDITYTPNAGFVGTDTLYYQVVDADGDTATAMQIITVLPANAPNITEAADDYATTPNGTPVSGNAITNDSDPEGDTQAVIPQTVTVPEGVFVIDAAGNYTFTPAPGFSGPVSFPYTVYDNDPTNPDTVKATVYIMVAPPTPSADPDINITNVNVPVPGDVSTNDENIPPGSTYGNPAPNPSNPGGATPVINPDGTYSFTSPIPGVFTFDVPVITPSGDTILVPLTITVLDPTIDNAPVANTDQATTTPTTPVVIPTLANDQAGNPGSPLVPGSVVITDQPSNGTTSVNPITGDITYTPNAGFVGTDTLYYQVVDADGDTATAMQIITVLPANAPNITEAADDYATTPNGTPVSGNAITNDSDPEGDTQAVIPQTVTVPEGVFVIDAAGNYTFTPAPGFSGPVSFPYTVYDNDPTNPDTVKATVYIMVTPPDPKPNPDVNTTWANIPVSGDVSTNDNYIPAGSTYVNPTPNPTNPGGAIPVVNSDGTYTFNSPIPGVFNFKVPILTPSGDTLLVDLQITVLDSASNANPPSANTDIATTAKNTPVSLNTLANDVTSNTGTGVGLNPSTVTVVDAPKNGTTTVDPLTGKITYTPNSGFVGVDTLKYSVQDSLGNTVTAYQYITIVDTVATANTTLAADDYNAVTSTAPVSGDALNNDTDAEGDGQTVIPQTTTIPGKGTLVLNADGTYTFTPVPGYVGPVSFPYEVRDARGAAADATIYFIVDATSAPLSLVYANFEVSSLNCQVKLSWSILNSASAKSFEIFESKNGVDFESIAVINKIANILDYSYTVDKKENQNMFYYIKAIDQNGVYTTTKVSKVNINCLNNISIIGYPNPVTDQLFIEIKNLNVDEAGVVIVRDAIGKVVRRIDANLTANQVNLLYVDMSNMASGLYNVEVRLGGQDPKVLQIRKD